MQHLFFMFLFSTWENGTLISTSEAISPREYLSVKPSSKRWGWMNYTEVMTWDSEARQAVWMPPKFTYSIKPYIYIPVVASPTCQFRASCTIIPGGDLIRFDIRAASNILPPSKVSLKNVSHLHAKLLRVPGANWLSRRLQPLQTSLALHMVPSQTFPGHKNCPHQSIQMLFFVCFVIRENQILPPDHLLLDSVPNLGPLISRWEINKFENCWYESVRILEVLKLLFQQFLNLSSSQRDLSGPILGDLSNNRWSGGISITLLHLINYLRKRRRLVPSISHFRIILFFVGRKKTRS